MFDLLRYDEAQPDYQQKLFDVSCEFSIILYLKSSIWLVFCLVSKQGGCYGS